MSSSAKSERRHAIVSVAPFGPPDGATGDLDEVRRHFVDFSEAPVKGALASRADDRTVRAIVGKKGVGKTLYLRRFQADAKSEPSVFTARRDTNAPHTNAVIRVCQMYDSAVVTEMWVAIWKRAIYRAVISHLACDRKLKEYVPPDVMAGLHSKPRLIGDLEVPRSVYDEVTAIISGRTTPHKLEEYLDDPNWATLEHWMIEALSLAPPLYLYIDAADGNFHRAPMYWLKFQKGLFLQIMRMLRDDNLGRLHIVGCIRDIVFSSTMRGDSSSNLKTDPHIRVLSWNYKAVRFFLEEKVGRLDADYRMLGARDDIHGWLGCSEIHNRARDVSEDVKDYMLRHTRLIPRDVVILGNEMCEAIAEAKAAGQTEMSERRIHRVVNKVARGIADEQLMVCCTQIAADKIPEHGARHDTVDYYIGTDQYSRGMFGRLEKVLVAIGCDRFDHEGLARLQELGAQALDGYDHLLDVLWQNGLLGYDAGDRDDPHAHFYASSDVEDFHLPMDHRSYVFHPCLAHRVRLEAVGEIPVRGYQKD